MTDEQTAAAIVAAFNSPCPMQKIQEFIVRALQAARGESLDADDVDIVAPTPEVVATLPRKAPPGHIIDDAGVVRKVLGTLPVTADSVVAMPGSFVYAKWWNGTIVRGFVRHEVHGLETLCFVEMTTTTDDGRTIGVRTFLSDCYSTREAAEAAKEATK